MPDLMGKHTIPQVSIIMAAHNAEKTIGVAIDSVYA